MIGSTLAGALLMQAPLAPEPPIGGVVWTLVVPVALFLVSFGATFLLYRHFARREGNDAE
jgi:hypothetical protein